MIRRSNKDANILETYDSKWLLCLWLCSTCYFLINIQSRNYTLRLTFLSYGIYEKHNSLYYYNLSCCCSCNCSWNRFRWLGNLSADRMLWSGLPSQVSIVLLWTISCVLFEQVTNRLILLITSICYTYSLRNSMYTRVVVCLFYLCRFYAEYTSRKKLCEKSELRYNYVQMPDDLTVLDNAHLRAPVDPHHVHQLA